MHNAIIASLGDAVAINEIRVDHSQFPEWWANDDDLSRSDLLRIAQG